MHGANGSKHLLSGDGAAEGIRLHGIADAKNFLAKPLLDCRITLLQCAQSGSHNFAGKSVAAIYSSRWGAGDKRRLRASRAEESRDPGLLDVLSEGLILVAFKFDDVLVDDEPLIDSNNFSCSEYGLPFTSSQPSYKLSSARRRLFVSTISVSPSR
jgi:hypothetical protein